MPERAELILLSEIHGIRRFATFGAFVWCAVVVLSPWCAEMSCLLKAYRITVWLLAGNSSVSKP
jgi:hypothetical protein